MNAIKAIIKNRATWAFLGVVVGQISPNLVPFVTMAGTFFGG